MKLKKLSLTNITKHKATELEFPDTGIVVVTGSNGSGKSSVVEGASTAGWGDSLRGKPVWGADQASVKAVVSFSSSDLEITRTRSGGSKKLSFAVNGKTVVYENNTKAQEALEHTIGSAQVWQQTCVFSSQDVEKFTSATDSERKRLLEDILDLARFDRAHGLCKEDLRTAKHSLDSQKLKLATEEERLTGLKNRLRDAEDALKTTPAPGTMEDLEARLEECQERLKIAQDNLAQDHKNILSLTGVRAHHLLKANKAREFIKQATAGVCGTCGQAIPAKNGCVDTSAAEKELLEASGGEDCANQAIEIAQKQIKQLNKAISNLVDTRAQISSQIESHKQDAARFAQASEKRAEVLLLLEDCEDSVHSLKMAVSTATGNTEVLSTVDKVLSVSGVRSRILHNALVGIEAAGNAWLAKLAATGLQMRLKPYSEKASGGVKDAVSLEIEGAGGGHGYRAASGGERRRLDLAIMLALADVAEAAHAVSRGTLFFDEVFDALDSDGVACVCSVLAELAQTTCVVVITHNQELADQLPAVEHWHVTEGVVSVT